MDDRICKLLHLALLAVGVAARTRHLDAVAFQDGSFWWRQERTAEVRGEQGGGGVQPRTRLSPMFALLFISFRRLANQL